MIYHCNSLIYHFLWNKLFITITDDAIFVCVYRTKIALIALSPGRRTRLNPDKTRILKSKWGKMYKRWRTHLNTFEKSDINQRKRETYSGGGTCLSSLSNDPPPRNFKEIYFWIWILIPTPKKPDVWIQAVWSSSHFYKVKNFVSLIFHIHNNHRIIN